MRFEDFLETKLESILSRMLSGHIPADEPLITRAEIMKRLNVSDSTWRKMCMEYNIPYYPGGKKGFNYKYSEVLERLRHHHKVVKDIAR